MLAPFRMVCRDFILPEPASYVFLYALFNLRKLLYLIDEEDIIYSSANTGTWMNSEWLCDDELDAMITDALATPDDTERYAKYDEITNYVKDVCPCALIASVYQSAAYHADYVEWPVAQYVQEGKIPACPAGYHYYFHDCKLIAE